MTTSENMRARERRLVREFLALPVEALPSADWEASGVSEDLGSCWPYLRDAMLDDKRRQLNTFCQRVVLSADRDGWREGVTISLASL